MFIPRRPFLSALFLARRSYDLAQDGHTQWARVLMTAAQITLDPVVKVIGHRDKDACYAALVTAADTLRYHGTVTVAEFLSYVAYEKGELV